MKTIAATGLLALSCALSCRADVLLGNLKLFGEDSFFSRGLGRSISFDLVSLDGSFELTGAVGDGIQQIPGTFTGNTAKPRDTARLVTGPGPQTLIIGGAASEVWVTPESILTFDSVPVIVPVLPVPPTDGKVLFDLAPTPFSMTGHITVNDFTRTTTLIDTDVTGSGLAYMKASAQDFGGTNPTYVVYSTDYVFSNPIPEPSAVVLLCSATVLLGGYAFRRRRRQRL